MASSVKEVVEAEWEDVAEAIEKCYELGWTDGLPVVPPTTERVNRFIEYAGRPADEVLGSVPERRREVTVGKVAANAVMAGCLPEHLPVVLAATEAMLDPAFNLIGPSSSLGGAAILAIVNGPVVRDLGINCRNNLFGPGNRANLHYRQVSSADTDEYLRLHSGALRPEYPRAPGEIQLLHCRERDGDSVESPPRRKRLLQGPERRDCVRL